uniref:helix-turn-helix domain-containing protein n=1 Tax=Streptomyces chartreusis TaxID=1969 RepID=UPI003F497A1F
MQWLRAILDGVDDATFNRMRSQATLHASDEEARRVAEEEVGDAQRLRGLLTDLRRRSDELGALNDIASRFVGLREVDPLLQEIVDQARQLLRVDVAYLSLLDDSRETLSVRAVSGNLSSALHTLQPPPDVGVAGVVLATGNPYWTLDLLDDRRVKLHSDGLAAIEAEGIHTVLGVPVRARREPMGVLFAAHRRIRSFADTDVLLLASLGAHAAVAIENARLFEERRIAIAHLDETTAQLQDERNKVRRGALFLEELTTAVTGEGGLSSVIEMLNATGGHAVAAVDENDVMLAQAGMEQPELWRGRRWTPGGSRASELFHADPSRVSAQLELPGGKRATLCPIRARGQYLGSIVLVQPSDDPPTDIRLLQLTALVSTVVLVTERAVRESQLRERDGLLSELFALDRITPTLSRRAQSIGLYLDSPLVVVAASAPEQQRHPVREAMSLVVDRFGGLVAEHAGMIVGLVSHGSSEEVRDAVLGQSAARSGTFGIVGPVSGFAALTQAHNDARRCVRVLHALGRDATAVTPDQLGPLHLFFSAAGQNEASQLIDRLLGPLLEYDTSRGAEMIRTCEIFLQTGRRPRDASQQLHIHTNTLYQRLARIDSLIGSEWRHDPERALETQIALQLLRVARTMDDVPLRNDSAPIA